MRCTRYLCFDSRSSRRTSNTKHTRVVSNNLLAAAVGFTGHLLSLLLEQMTAQYALYKAAEETGLSYE